MAKPTDRPHLFLRARAIHERFTSTRAGGGRKKLKDQNRKRHGAKLRDEFEAAVAEAPEDRPVKVEVRSEPGYELELKSLDSSRAGSFELLSVRMDGRTTVATVLVPRKALKHFRRTFEEYLTKNTKTGRPSHQNLVANISAIHSAAVRSIWTDTDDQFPTGRDAIWWEAWLRRTGEDVATQFRAAVEAHGARAGGREIRFVDRVVLTVFGTIHQLGAIFEDSDALAELRRAKPVASEYLALEPHEQAEWARELSRRVRPPPHGSPAVCILDTGTTRQHVLLEPALPVKAWLTCDPRWGAHDHHSHGTEMAGVALYGDLAPLLESGEPVPLAHSLESVKILSPTDPHAPDVYGAITQEAVARAEIAAPQRNRAICLAITTRDGRDRGRPSSWSAAIDESASGAMDGRQRLFVVAAGNTDRGAYLQYPNSNATDGIRDPAQAWNALTVGAMADRVEITEPQFAGWAPIAELDDLAPCSTTSATWPTSRRWPMKPDIVMPGGNAARDPDGTQVDHLDSLSLLTTNWQPLAKQFAATGETSAASALAARLAARIHARYADAWPETVRALIAHSADWTEPMMRRFPVRDRAERVRWFGLGVPDEPYAMFSAADAVTLIKQAAIRPFDRRDGRYVTREMHLYNLPWPKDVLQELGETEVELRVTLSYFVEPSPGDRGWKHRHRYASHGLRFDVKTAEETVEQFRTRINRAAQEEDGEPTSRADASGWALGAELRSSGSLHSDRWSGSAVRLAERGVIAVYPTIGWWRERPALGRWGNEARYALVVSIRTPEVDTDIYTPIATQVGIPIPVQVGRP